MALDRARRVGEDGAPSEHIDFRCGAPTPALTPALPRKRERGRASGAIAIRLNLHLQALVVLGTQQKTGARPGFGLKR